MRYSYISPRKKTVFTKEIQILLIFFSVTLFMLFSTYAFLIFKDQRFMQEMSDIKMQKDEYRANIVKMNNEIATIEKQLLLSEKIFTKNSVLRDSINNLFDLVLVENLRLGIDLHNDLLLEEYSFFQKKKQLHLKTFLKLHPLK